MDPEIYIHPQEVWDEKRCQSVSRRREKDFFGSKHPYPGLVSPSGSAYPQYGEEKTYNGGCIHGDKWYRGEFIPLPSIPPGWKFIYRLSWGTYLVKVDYQPARPSPARKR